MLSMNKSNNRRYNETINVCLECVHNDIPRISGLRSLVGTNDAGMKI